jgi:fructose/tagatose bisphosphate aldolase
MPLLTSTANLERARGEHYGIGAFNACNMEMVQAIVPLDLALVEEIARRVQLPLVLHGSSGVVKTEEEAESHGISLKADEGSLQEAISLGIAKINVSTELQVTFLRALYAAFKKNPAEADVRKLFLPARAALKNQVCSLIRLFGSSGKADIGPGLGRRGSVTDAGWSPSRPGRGGIERAK